MTIQLTLNLDLNSLQKEAAIWKSVNLLWSSQSKECNRVGHPVLCHVFMERLFCLFVITFDRQNNLSNRTEEAACNISPSTTCDAVTEFPPQTAWQPFTPGLT